MDVILLLGYTYFKYITQMSFFHSDTDFVMTKSCFKKLGDVYRTIDIYNYFIYK